jgi:glycosyltransferase involved in cell wall biosynthesis
MTTEAKAATTMSYIGCWYKNDMYSHNCRHLVDSLRGCGVNVNVVTSNCRCFSSAQQFDITVSELINPDCKAIKIPHAPAEPGFKHGALKRFLVKTLRLDLWTATARGFLYFRDAKGADVIHYDQVLEAFGVWPLHILAVLAKVAGTPLTVTVHEIDAMQKKRLWINRLYGKCAKVFVYSADMWKQLVDLGVDSEKLRIIKYGLPLPKLGQQARSHYIYFGGHHILRGKGYAELLDSLAILKEKGHGVRMLCYVGHGCKGLDEAQAMAAKKGVCDMIEWGEFFSVEELATAYQSSKACVIPYTGGSARHPVSCAMANATPVIATRAVDIPEYLGDAGVYVNGSGQSIAAAILEIEVANGCVKTLGERLRAKAVADLDIAKLAQEMAAIYCGINREKECCVA